MGAAFRGIGFPFTKGNGGIPQMEEDEDIVWSDVKLLLTTQKRSRVHRPDLGTGLQRIVFENTGPLMNAKIYREIVSAMANYEPRAVVSNVSIQDDKTTVTIDTTVTIRGITKTVSTSVSRS